VPAAAPASATLLVLVDGMNVARSGAWAGVQGELAVDMLVRRLADAVASWASASGVEVLLVFDGAAPVPSTPACRIAGSGGATADELLERAAATARREGRTHWVASSDRVVQEVAGAGAQRVLGAAAFVAELEAAGPEPEGGVQPAPGPAGATGPGASKLGEHLDPGTRDGLERLRRGES
jgi:predicted RNA-binding protein with PIN domain